MQVTLDKENRFLNKFGGIDLKQAFIYSGIKAAWCYKPGSATPDSIRSMSEDTLLRIGIETFLNDHGTPDEHYEISVEITEIPKLLCMILNDEHQYTTCERSLRYTKVKESEYITDLEVAKYNKWYNLNLEMFKNNYYDWFLKVNKNDDKMALKDMEKKAGENARNFVSILTPTSIAYTAPWYQWQKIATYLLDMANSPKTNLEKLAAPYAFELVSKLIDLNVVVLTEIVDVLYPDFKTKNNFYKKFLYTNNKGIKLSMFAHNNPFSGINKPNEFGSSISYNSFMSIAACAQAQRHRTCDFEFQEMKEFKFYIPEFIKNTEYEQEYIKDMLEVKHLYPQGQMLNFNLISSLKNIIWFMGQERACEKAQQEIANWYVNIFLPDIIKGLEEKSEYQEEVNVLKRNYLNKCRCAYPNYHCPSPCGHPRTQRPF